MQTHNFEFKGKNKEYFDIWIINIVFTVMTFGIYSPWAKVRTNQYFYNKTSLDGDSFSYLANPYDILSSRMFTVIALTVWFYLYSNSLVTGVVATLIIIAVSPILFVRIIAYELKMTQYRNIRFNFIGNYREAYIPILLKPLVTCAFASIAFTIVHIMVLLIFEIDSSVSSIIPAMCITSILASPLFIWVIKGIHEYTLNNTRYGALKFSTSLDANDIYRIYSKFIFMVIIVTVLYAVIDGIFVVLASNKGYLIQLLVMFLTYISLISMMIYFQAYLQSELRSYLFSNTKLNKKIQLQSSMSVKPYASLIITNMLLLVITLGLAFPIVKVRTAKYIASVSHIKGNLKAIRTTEQVTDETGSIAVEVSTAVGIAFETA